MQGVLDYAANIKNGRTVSLDMAAQVEGILWLDILEREAAGIEGSSTWGQLWLKKLNLETAVIGEAEVGGTCDWRS